MGHIHLGVLPGTRKWRDVVGLLEGLAHSNEVIAAAAAAAEADLQRAADDPTFVESVRLLAAIPRAAAGRTLVGSLAELAVATSPQPQLLELIAAVGTRLDEVAGRAARRTDFGEMARRALLSSFAEHIGGAQPSHFEAAPEDLRAALHRFAQPRGFTDLARGYFTHLLSQTLGFWLDRTLSAQVGPGRRFAHVGERRAFDAALAQHCHEATRIIQEFSAGWYGKMYQRGGPITGQDATVLGAVALKKITAELRRKRDADG